MCVGKLASFLHWFVHGRYPSPKWQDTKAVGQVDPRWNCRQVCVCFECVCVPHMIGGNTDRNKFKNCRNDRWQKVEEMQGSLCETFGSKLSK